MPTGSDDPLARLDRAVADQAAAEAATKAVAAARARLVLGRDAASAFFATLALRLTAVVDRACPTAATDGRALVFNPAFVLGLSADELVGVVAHEVLHCALAHHARRGFRDPGRWNAAGDLAVNPLLVSAGFALPPTRLMPGEGSYAHHRPGLTAEAYYAALTDPSPPGAPGRQADPGGTAGVGPTGGPPADDPGGCGAVRDPAEGSAGAGSPADADWAVAVAQAGQAARGRGDLPAGLARLVDQVVRPRPDWREVLRAFLTRPARADPAWGRPDRRFVWRGLYLPGRRSEAVGGFVVAVDTSGSIAARELGRFAGALDGLLGTAEATVTVLGHDTAVHSVRTWEPGDGPFTLDPVGGGGTSHACVFDWLDRSRLDPAGVVCLTDLETTFPARVPAVPVLWAVVGGNPTDPPFGSRLTIDD